jgi:ABC-type multidrug transport system ATPase subunit
LEQENLIQTEKLSKNYRSIHALHDLDLTVKKGDIYGFLGPNGSGKTTTIRLMLGLIKPSFGTAKLRGYNVRENPVKALDKVGSIVETPRFYSYLSGYQNLAISGRLLPGFKQQEILPILEMVGLSKNLKQKTSAYSLGMKQRLGLGMAMLANPEIIILDEPTISLDPQGMKEVRDLIVQLNQEKGITFFLSTHLLYEVEQICNRVGILKKGVLIYEGKVDEIIKPVEEIVEIYTDEKEKAQQILSKIPFIQSIEAKQKYILLKIPKGKSGEVNRLFHEESISLDYIIPKNPSLEDFFLEITKGEKNV